jgi:hypothetical protein
MGYISFEVRTECLNTMNTNFGFNGWNQSSEHLLQPTSYSKASD